MRLTLCLVLIALVHVAYGFMGGSFSVLPAARILRPAKGLLPSTSRKAQLPLTSLRASHDVDRSQQHMQKHQQPDNNFGPQKMTVKQTSAPTKQEQGGPIKTHPMSVLEMRLRPLSEWKQTEHGFLLACATPGLAKEDITLEVVDQPVPPTSRYSDDQFDLWTDPFTSVLFGEPVREPIATGPRAIGHYLVVSGETKAKEKAVDDNNTMGFRAFYKPFSQKIRLPEYSDKDTLTATYENGILLVYVNYKQPERIEPKKLTIPIN